MGAASFFVLVLNFNQKLKRSKQKRYSGQRETAPKNCLMSQKDTIKFSF